MSRTRRARLEPILERVGLLAEPGMLLDLRRPADVLIERAIATPQAAGAPLAASMSLALDIKGIIKGYRPAVIIAVCALIAFRRWADRPACSVVGDSRGGGRLPTGRS